MATILFGTLLSGASVPFDPALDVLRFDSAGITAADLIVSGPVTGADPSFGFGGKTITLTGVSLLQLTTTNVTFANGSRLMVGDNTTGIVNDNAANTLNGSAAGDLIIGRGGNDTLRGLAGNDVLDGGDGVDTASFAGAVAAVTASLVTNTATGGAGSDTLISIENLIGSNFNDTLTGDARANTIIGGLGNDVMNGGGGAGLDTAAYTTATTGVTVNLALTTQQNTVGAGLDTLSGFENLTGSNGDDALRGNALPNVLNGLGGNDILIGGGGADRLFGGDHDDVLVFDAADLIQSGGAGTDTLQVNGAGVAVNLTAAAADIERVNLTGSGNNTLAISAARIIALNALDSLRVTGNAGDAVQSADAWLYQGVFSDALGSFARYTSGGATLEVDTDVDRSGIAFSVNLGTLNGTNGFRLQGAAPGDNAGVSVSDAGDVSGDGFADLLVGADGADANGVINSNTGAAYVVFGHGGGFAANLSLGALTAAQGFRLSGAAANDLAGRSVSSAGDVNGGGINDLLVAAFGADANAGAAHVVFGKSGGLAAHVNLGALTAADGSRLSGAAAGDNAGTSVSSAGDINGDGFGDLLVGARSADANGVDSGAAYVVFGRLGGFGPDLNLAALTGVNGFRLPGAAAGDYAGSSVSDAGDVNGDGFADLIVGAPLANPLIPDSGAAYVVFGKSSGFAANFNFRDFTYADGSQLAGAAAGDRTGFSVSSAGDVNGDGFDDLIVGAPLADANGVESGAAYVVFGRLGGFDFGAHLDLSALTGVNGFRLLGATTGDNTGGSVSGAGDVNGDGFDDLLVGASLADANGLESGAAYVVFGKSGGFAANLDLGALTAAEGFRLSGAAAYDYAAGSVSGAGDVNGDGFDDLLVGASLADANGAAYIVFGGDFGGKVNFAGTAGNDAFAGTAAAEIALGGLGDDILNGGAGADVLRGGAGNDTLVFDAADRRLDGGAGTDVLRLAGAGRLLNPAAIPDARITGIEVIDLTGSGDNSLALGRSDLINLSDSGNLLRVIGNAGDAVRSAEYWTKQELFTDAAGSFARYTSGGATLEVHTTVARTTLRLDLPLGGLDGANGFRLAGAAAGDTTGFSVSDAGDVNGDGFDDLLVGAPLVDADGVIDSNTGAAYLVFGKGSGFAANLDLGALTAADGFRLSGAAAGDAAGYSVSSAGDVNGDGLADLLVAASGANPTGAAYVVFGKSGGLGPEVSLGALNGNGFKLSAAGDEFRTSVSNAGDVNGDGFDDVLVKAMTNVISLVEGQIGRIYLVFGRAAGFAPDFDLSALNGANGFRLTGGMTNSWQSVSGTGDVNGDGFDDLLVGTDRGIIPTGGGAYVVFGKSSGFAANLNLQALTAADGFRLSGAAGDRAGYSVSNAGDVNGDGTDDLLVGARDANPNGTYSGAVYVVFGKSSGFAANVDLGALTAADGFRLSGAAAFDRAGHSASSAGDVNGDGFDDLIVGALAADANGDNSGAAYVVFGKSSGFAADINLGALSAADGFRLSGAAANELAGRSVSSAGDVNGDGFDDLVVGATRSYGYASGAAYTVFGGDFTERVNFAGTAGSDSFLGTAAAEIALGGLGSDFLNGGAGVDVLRGGAGNDTLVFDAADRRLDGGAGTDVLVVAGAGQVVDLTVIPDTRITGIEVINLTGIGNSLVMGLTDLTRLSDTSNLWRVMGDARDAVTAGIGWLYQSDITIAGQVYAQYTQGAATLQVDADVDRSGIGFSVNLDSLQPRFSGATAGDFAGRSVSSAGDVNGDGFDDLLVGAYRADANGVINSDTGAAYVVFGKSSAFAANLNLGALTAADGFRLSGAAAGDFAGNSVSSAGDVNGDGIDDLMVGAPTANANGVINSDTGAAYVVFGTPPALTRNVNLGALPAAQGFRLSGAAAGDRAGSSVSSAGDVNGDGFDDLLVGAPFTDANGVINSNTGAAYVVFGKSSGFANLNLGALTVPEGFRLSGAAAGDRAGYSVSNAGDVNGDGFDDLIVGAPLADANGADSGAAYVVFGRSGGFANLSLGALPAARGFRLSGAAAGDRAGYSVSSAGDVNGDGFGDLIVGAPTADADGIIDSTTGAAYVVFGRSGFATGRSLATLDGITGFKVSGAAAGDFAGRSVSSAGDVNGDGFDDLLVGASLADANGAINSYAGAAYVVFGKSSGFAANLDLGALTAADGFRLFGAAAGDLAGRSVSSAGDVNGDGFDDLLVGADAADANGVVNSNTGAAYTLFGRDFTGTAVQSEGTAGNDTLSEKVAGVSVVAGLGDDLIVLLAGGGAAHGGGGNDTISIADSLFRRLDGGAGADTLRLDGPALGLDLSLLPSGKIEGIEAIDLRAQGANTLRLTAVDVLDLSDSTNRLLVRGGAGDTVDATDPGWVQGADQTIGTVAYHTYTQKFATLLVQVEITNQGGILA